ncbi:Transposon Ty3-G Gag-Pol polyprotein [Senna tora]|uniref:Transposon Ty3-G Gag-Pol polyprotein n=1 Tax=Senna tora TaxID=362788 RepID=A0A834VXN3_9FABA|nr:Transposon Ty3-G Gag-Pol polyprotein [Senna tora]
MLQHIQGDRDYRPQGHRVRDGDYHGWAKFQKAKPPSFRGELDKTLAEVWIQELEKLFKVLRCSDEQKVKYVIYLLASEAENWWKGAQQLIGARGTQLTWENFKIAFFENYYLVSVRNQNEIEFMQVKQGNMPFEEFITKYEELSNFTSYLKHNADEALKAMHVTTALNTTMRNVIAPLDIKNYAELVNRCCIVARSIEVAEKLKQGTNFSNKRPMNFSKGEGSNVKKPMGSKSAPNSCPNCGKTHGGRPCQFGSNVCYSCGQTGHYARECPHNKQTSEGAKPTTKGRVFTLKGEEATKLDDLIEGTSMINGKLMTVLFDSGIDVILGMN